METKEELIGRIEELVGQLATRFGAEDDDERKWLRDQCSPAAQRVLAELSVQALHLLDAIPHDDGTGASVNIVGLSATTGTPKGTVSKTVQRLVSDGLVERHQLPGNRKEVHLRLTALGAEIQHAHRGLHEQMGSAMAEFLDRYTEAELDVITRVMGDLLRMPREGLRFRPDQLD